MLQMSDNAVDHLLGNIAFHFQASCAWQLLRNREQARQKTAAVHDRMALEYSKSQSDLKIRSGLLIRSIFTYPDIE